MEFTSETGKIPQGYGYVLNPSSLFDALSVAGVEIEVHVVRRHGTRLFDAHFWPPSPNVPRERLYVVVGTIIARDLQDFRQRVKFEAIPNLVRWISNLVALDLKSPVRRQAQTIQLLPCREQIP